MSCIRHELHPSSETGADQRRWGFGPTAPCARAVRLDEMDEHGRTLMASTTSVLPSGNDYIDGILLNAKWDPATGPVTFSFPNTADDYSDYDPGSRGVFLGDDGSKFFQVSAVEMQAVRSLLGSVTQFTGLGLNEISDTAADRTIDARADIRVGGSTEIGGGTTFPPTSTPPFAGDVWIGPGFGNPVRGDVAFHLHAHELGHALGLKEAEFADGSAARFVNVPLDRASPEFSVMSQRSFEGGPVDAWRTIEFWGHPQSFMMLDIAALQHLYGANYGFRSNDTHYHWNAATGEMSVDRVPQGAPGDNRVFTTIWDGDGHDTYDFSDYADRVLIDLTPGGWSVTSQAQLADLGFGNKARGNVFNALLADSDLQVDDPRSLIEDAIAGSGNDVIRGNDAGNYLGGRAGDDLFVASAGLDFYDGGDGFDTVVFNVATGDATVTSFGGVDWAVGTAGGFAILHGVELAVFNDNFLTLV
jgi:serralysin